MTFDIKTLNQIAEAGLATFATPSFSLNKTTTPAGIIVRSHEIALSELTPTLSAISRAGVGVNNIPVADCTAQGIVVINTPGANANAVKELVLASLLISVRPLIPGATWVQSISGPDVAAQVEAQKKQFSGTELEGKKLGVIGLGAIGAMIANDAYRLGMDVLGFDPYVSVDTAWNISRRVKRASNLEEILKTCDFITIHVPLTAETHGMINEKELALLKDGAVLLNFSRGELVDNPAIISALENQLLKEYICDFPEAELIGVPGVTLLPHLGASTAEAEINCAKVASRHLKDFLTTGNIQQSVNFPTVNLSFYSPYRVSIAHKNVPNMLGAISSTAAELGLNIDNLINRSRQDLAYTLLDLTQATTDELALLAEKLKALPDVIRLRVIKNQQGEI